MKKLLFILIAFVMFSSMTFALIEQQRVDGRLEFHQKLEPIKLYVSRDKPCLLDFDYPIKSQFFTDTKSFTIKAGFNQLFTDNSIVITANNTGAKTYLFVELETYKVKKRPCHFIEIIEDSRKAEDKYYISSYTDVHYIENGIKVYHGIDNPN